jgi:hypothetical protein
VTKVSPLVDVDLLFSTPQASLKLSEELAVRNGEIAKRKAVVEGELSEAEPALIEAQKAVKNIKKQHLDELRCVWEVLRLLRSFA